ncbi:MAG: hypothetical protein SFU25_07125, partial [Candidatus Caenarcaniphilales bacterium]|nr:hypothetical protein [Candidatus Caenarcaniphilales bacterium]
KPPYKTARKFSDLKQGEYIFYTEYSHEFSRYHSLWYDSKFLFNMDEKPKKSYKKILPSNISELLVDPVALAVWYLDDGSKRIDSNACRFASQSFSEKENIKLQECLQSNFNLYSTIDKWWDKKSNRFIYGICIPSKNSSYKDFKKLIYDFVEAEIPSMLYKLQ